MLRFGWSLVGLALLSCAGESPSARSHCTSLHVGIEGATLTGAAEATLVIPPGALAAPLDVAVCLVEVGRVPHQHTDMIEITPIGAVLRDVVQLTLPVDETTPTSLLLEVREQPNGPLVQVRPLRRIGTSPTVTFTMDRFGDVRVLEDPSATPFDAGAGGPFDGEPTDSPRAIGPVAVGPDLVPADYSCLGTIASPPVGALAPVTVHVTDWADHLPRADYMVQAASAGGWPMGDCTGFADCVTGTTDASGDVTLTLRAGPVWLHAFGGPSTDPSRVAAPTWIVGLGVGPSTSALDVVVPSQRTQNNLTMAMGFGGAFALGAIRDCAGHPVQRARVRVFDGHGNEALFSPIGGPAIIYGNGSGFPSSSADRSSIDGVFLASPQGLEDGRIEAWGRFVIDGPDMLLACVAVSYQQTGGLTMADLLPLPSDPLAACGSLP